MNDINLLPPIQKQKRLALSIVTYLTIGFVILLVSIGGFALTLTTIQLTLNDRVSQYHEQIATLQRQIKTYETLESDVKDVNQTLDILHKIFLQELSPTTILDNISSKINNDVIATSIVFDRKDITETKIPITITGSAKTRASIIQFKRNLETTGTLKNVTYTINGGDSAAAGSSAQSETTLPFTYTIAATYEKATKP